MLYRRQGYPEEDEIVLCKVTKMFPNAVFVDLLEYNNSGLVHISEIAPGRIRNLRDYVAIGREIVCKVLRIDKEKGHTDLSLRRVNSHQRQEKLDEIKQELKAETLLKNLAKKLNQPAETLYSQIAGKIFKEYSHLYICFKDLVAGKAALEKLGVEKSLAQEITAAVIEKFKPEKIYLRGEITLKTYIPDGIDKIKKTLYGIENISPSIIISYLGGGRYRLVIEDVDYKPAEKNLQKVEAILNQFNDKVSSTAFQREKE